ncbi:MAG: NAD(P)/FAD-dependent oxidoreductase [Hydrogenophaga sp.]|jgi:flavin-dependent dehydrogenase|uniref:NAD(P)/FAD-dependent oxidoreductase n=1 Tax=Hydrogenophaga sp. TaxID=1904254 RepID=UPI001D7D612F|nr:NAD(P)/FAD-dependent oxidoreductase [Hydrogenophaga sp.]MBW0169193.1 tryptophan 7-halogenase [Hydrogenophaga sp.]MBW0183249.1 tryptophan 7-halogenase [Hydrogenophaga sp.]
MNHDNQGPERLSCDVLVIGGGPAGSTVSPMLAQKGHRVVLLEKAHHPRFHIGESLLPANLPLLERLGVADEVRAIGQYKPGAEFVSPHHDHTQTFHFAEAWDKSMPYAYQVKRAEFDEILIRNAERKGVEVHEGCKARSVEFLPDRSVRVHAEHDDGRTSVWDARFLVDASGRDTFLASRFKIKERNPRHNSAAVYGHFANARRNAGEAEGNITIFWFDHGWFWFIPLTGGITSVGMVTWPYHMKTRAGRSVDQFLLDNIATCKGLAERLQDARLSAPAEATGNFSYAAQHNHGDNYLMLGDAYTFIDPVFSSGVWLAMNGGELGAQTIDTCLRHPKKARAALRHFDRQSRRGPKAFSWFIYRVTNPIMRDFFMGPRNVFRVKEALLSTLAGDVYGGAPIGRSMLAFKALYFVANILQPRRAFAAWRKRRDNIRPADEAALARVP